MKISFSSNLNQWMVLCGRRVKVEVASNQVVMKIIIVVSVNPLAKVKVYLVKVATLVALVISQVTQVKVKLRLLRKVVDQA